MAASAHKNDIGVEIWDRVIRSQGQISPAAARALLKLQFDERDRRRMGDLTVGTTVPRILDYVRDGGAAIAIGSSASLAYHAGLPVENHLVENGRPLTREQYFTPGSVLDMKVEPASPLAHGFEWFDARLTPSAKRPARNPSRRAKEEGGRLRYYRH